MLLFQNILFGWFICFSYFNVAIKMLKITHMACIIFLLNNTVFSLENKELLMRDKAGNLSRANHEASFVTWKTASSRFLEKRHLIIKK